MTGIDWILFFYSLKPLPSPITHLPLPRHIIQISKQTLERLAYIHVLMLPSCLLWRDVLRCQFHIIDDLITPNVSAISFLTGK